MHSRDENAPHDAQRCVPLIATNHYEEEPQPNAISGLAAGVKDAALYVTDTVNETTIQTDPRQRSRSVNATLSGSDTNQARLVQTKSLPTEADCVEVPAHLARDSSNREDNALSLPSKRRKHSAVHDNGQIRRLSQHARRPNRPGAKKRIPADMQLQWRIGAAPSATLALSKEESTMTKIIGQASAFYTSMFEVYWSPALQRNAFIYDLDNRVEVFRDSSVTAACLVAVGKQNSAQRMLDKVLPSMDDLLRNPTPALYLILAELALDLAKIPGDNVREQIKRYLGGRALTILGAEHPITQLLTINLPLPRKEMLGDRLWNTVLPILAKSFGADHYQSSTQVYCQARNMAASGRSEDAINRIQALIDRWAHIYGNNSLIVCYTKIELANILVSSGSIMKAELVVSDALRTSDIIHQAALRREDCHASEKRHRQSSIAFPRVAGLRTLGKLHCLRGNFGAATHYYSRAVAEGSPSLGTGSAVVELAQNDLHSSQALELKQSLEQFSLVDLSKLTNIVPTPIC